MIPLHLESLVLSAFQLTQSSMQDFSVYRVERVRSLTVPLPDEARSPLGQSTEHNRVKIDASEPVIVVKFFPGQGFAAMPVVPDVTGAELVVDAVWVVKASEVVDDVEIVEDREDEELSEGWMVLALIKQ